MSLWPAVPAGAGEKVPVAEGGTPRVAVVAMRLGPMAEQTQVADTATRAVVVDMVAVAWPAPMAEETRRTHQVERAWRFAATVVAVRLAAATSSADTLAADHSQAGSEAADTLSVSHIHVPALSAEETPAVFTWVPFPAARSAVIRERHRRLLAAA